MNRFHLLKMADDILTIQPDQFWIGATYSKQGTCACVVGWLPHFFPLLYGTIPTNGGNWEVYILPGEARKAGRELSRRVGIEQVAQHHFDLSYWEVIGLFYPDRQKSIHPDMPTLTHSATTQEAAAAIRKFVDLVDKGQYQLKKVDKFFTATHHVCLPA